MEEEVIHIGHLFYLNETGELLLNTCDLFSIQFHQITVPKCLKRLAFKVLFKTGADQNCLKCFFVLFI